MKAFCRFLTVGKLVRYCLTSIVGQFAKANAAFQNFKTIDTTLQAQVSAIFFLRTQVPQFQKLFTREWVDIPPLHGMILLMAEIPNNHLGWC